MTRMTPEPSRRQRLDHFVESGRLRDAVMARGADSDVADLLVDLCSRYCAPRRRRLSAAEIARLPAP